MKHLLTILSGLLVALLFARCADDDNLSGGIDGLPERGIVIRLSTGELDTRTELTSTGDYHHVEEVWAVLYKLEGTDANDLNNYKLKGNPTKLGSMEDGQFVAWNPYKAPDAPKFNPADPDNPTDAEREKYEQELAEYNNKWGGEYGNGKVQGREFVLPESGAMTAGTYRVLCIGFDEASKTVYDLMSSEGTTLNTTIFGENKTLADAKATLTETKAYEEQTGTYQMYGYDGTGELFAGWTEFEFEPDNINIAEVELKRRVAGILCYVTDIPARIENTEVKGIRLCLNTEANSEIGLCRLDKPWEDFGAGGGYSSEYAGGTTLAYQDLSDWTADGEILKKGEEGNLVMGAYIIPINVVEDNNVTNTLSVQLFGGDSYDYEDGNLGELIKTFNVLNEQGHSTERGETAERYNILPNYIYHIGDKDDDTDEPMSLLGQKITVKPKVWTGETIPVEFPSVPIFCTMELWGNDGIYTTQRYIFDCIGIDDVTPVGIFTGDYSIHEELRAPRLWLRINPSVLKSKWKLTIYDLDNPSENSMLYLNLGGGIYDNSYEVSDDDKNEMKQFPVVMTDNLTGNFRTAVIQLDTYDASGTSPIRSDTIHVHQYEAILNENLGFSRFDLGTERDYRTGKVTTEYQYIWGYQGSYGVRTFFPLTSGLANYKRAKGDADDYPNLYGSAFYGGAAFYYSAVQRFTINNGKKEYNVENDIYDVWFLPAYDEMESFMKLARSVEGNYGIKAGEAYWTGSAGDGVTSWDIFLDGTFTGGGLYGAQRTVLKYIRRACQIKTD